MVNSCWLARVPLTLKASIPPVPATWPSNELTTPGTTFTKSRMLRPFSARLFNWLPVIRSERSPELACNWSSPPPALTFTISDVPPSASSKTPALSRSVALRATPAFSSTLNPSTSTLMVYVPGGRLGTTKSPLSFVTTARVTPDDGFETVTDACGSTPPVVSLTVPLIEPEVT